MIVVSVIRFTSERYNNNGENNLLIATIRDLLHADAAKCPKCNEVLEASNSLPLICSSCGKKRGLGWANVIQARAQALNRTGFFVPGEET